jgi:threonine dehydrogenase-like Zn-dependent dehydrogenase
VVVEATSGNTGIGLAMVCAQKGYPLVTTMAETFSVERRRLMRFLGAKVVLTPAAQRGMGMVVKAAELAKTHGWFGERAPPDVGLSSARQWGAWAVIGASGRSSGAAGIATYLVVEAHGMQLIVLR